MTESQAVYPLKHRNWTKAIIMLISSLTVMAGAAIAASTPKLKEAFSDLENAEFLSKLVISLPALFIAVVSPIVGQFIDRYGRLRFLIFGLVLYAVAGTSGYFLDDIYHILISRAFLGMSVACIMPVAVALIGDFFTGSERETMTALQGASMALGGVVFVGIGGVLADVSWQAPFLVYLASLLFLILVLIFLEEPKLDRTQFTSKNYFSGLTRIHYYLLGSGLLIMLVFYMIPLQIPFLLKSMGENEMKWIGLAMMTNTFSSIATAISYKLVRRYLSFSAVNGVLLIVMALGFIIIYSATSYWMVVGGLFTAGLGLGLFMPNFSLWILEITPVQIRGRVVGLVSSAIFLGQFASPYFIQPLQAAEFTLSETFGMASLVLFALSAAFWIMTIRNSQRSQNT